MRAAARAGASPNNAKKRDIEHICALVIHLVTGEYIINYMKLKRDPPLNERWGEAFREDLEG